MTPGYQFTLALFDKIADLSALLIALAALGQSCYMFVKGRLDSVKARREDRLHEMNMEDRRVIRAATISLLSHHQAARNLCIDLWGGWDEDIADKLHDHMNNLSLSEVKIGLCAHRLNVTGLALSALCCHITGYHRNREKTPEEQKRYETAYRDLSDKVIVEYNDNRWVVAELLDDMKNSTS